MFSWIRVHSESADPIVWRCVKRAGNTKCPPTVKTSKTHMENPDVTQVHSHLADVDAWVVEKCRQDVKQNSRNTNDGTNQMLKSKVRMPRPDTGQTPSPSRKELATNLKARFHIRGMRYANPNETKNGEHANVRAWFQMCDWLCDLRQNGSLHFAIGAKANRTV